VKSIPFEEARQSVHKLGFKSRREYWSWCKSGNKPDYIPTHPERAYGKEWKGWGDWLGTGRTGHGPMEVLPFEEARKIVRSLRINSERKWRKWVSSENRRKGIPSSPHGVYKEEWKGWGDWLGTGIKTVKDRKYLPFSEAREYVHSLGLKSQSEWNRYCKSGNKPDYIPHHAYRTYKEEWKGTADWLGTESWPFLKAREFVHSLGLKNRKEYQKWSLYRTSLLTSLAGDVSHSNIS
jgi:hypothetical protein